MQQHHTRILLVALTAAVILTTGAVALVEDVPGKASDGRVDRTQPSGLPTAVSGPSPPHDIEPSLRLGAKQRAPEPAPTKKAVTSAAPPAFAPAPEAPPQVPAPAPGPAPPPPPIAWRASVALGTPQDGTLVDGVQLPIDGQDFFTWDLVQDRVPNADGRRWGTDRLIRTVLETAADHRAAHPDAPRLGIGDLSLPGGGEIGNHASHENGLDVDVYYPRLDRTERQPERPEEVDRALAQDLVNRFVNAGAEYVFVGPRSGLVGPPEIVQPLARHDKHMHVRFPNPTPDQ